MAPFFFRQRKRGGGGVTGRRPRMVDLKGRRMCNERSTGDSGESFDMRERRETRRTRSGWRCFTVGRGRLLSCLVRKRYCLEGEGDPSSDQVQGCESHVCMNN